AGNCPNHGRQWPAPQLAIFMGNMAVPSPRQLPEGLAGRRAHAGTLDKSDPITKPRGALPPFRILHGGDPAEWADSTKNLDAHNHIAGSGEAMPLDIQARPIAVDTFIGFYRCEMGFIAGKDPDVSPGEINFGMGIHEVDNRTSPTRLHDAVRINKGHQWRLRHRSPTVAGRSWTRNVLDFQPHFRKGFAHPQRRLPRTVVDNDDLHGDAVGALGHQRLEAERYVLRPVEMWNDDAQLRRRFHA